MTHPEVHILVEPTTAFSMQELIDNRLVFMRERGFPNDTQFQPEGVRAGNALAQPFLHNPSLVLLAETALRFQSQLMPDRYNGVDVYLDAKLARLSTAQVFDDLPELAKGAINILASQDEKALSFTEFEYFAGYIAIAQDCLNPARLMPEYAFENTLVSH